MYYPGGDPFTGPLVSLLVAAALFSPGLWAPLVAAEHFALDAAGALALAFAATLAVAGLVGEAAWLLGAPLAVVTVALVLAALVAPVIFIARRGRRRWGAGGLPGVLIALGAALMSLFQGQAIGGTQDEFYHLAAMRSLLASGRPLVTDPLFGTATRALDPSSGAWHTLGASLAMVTRADLVALAPGLTAAAAAAFTMCLWVMFRRVTGDGLVPAFMTVGFLVIVQAMDFRFIGYPKEFSWGLAFFGLVLLARVAVSPERALQVAAAGVGFATIVTHLGSAELYVVGAAILMLFVAVLAVVAHRGEKHFDVRALGRMALAAGAAAVLALPVLVSRLVALNGSDSLNAGSSAQLSISSFSFLGLRLLVERPSGESLVLLVAAVPLLVMAAITVVRTRDPRAFMALSLGSLRVVLLFDPLAFSALMKVSPYMTERLAGLLIFAPFCLLAWGLGTGIRERKVWLVSGCSAALLVSLLMTLPSLKGIWTGPYTDPSTLAYSKAADLRTAWGPDALPKLRAVLGPDRPVVAAFPNTSLQLAGIANVRIIAVPQDNTPAYLEDHEDADAERLDMYGLVDPATTEAARVRIVKQYGARFVVIDPVHVPVLASTAQQMMQDSASFRLVLFANGLYVFAVS